MKLLDEWMNEGTNFGTCEYPHNPFYNIKLIINFNVVC